MNKLSIGDAENAFIQLSIAIDGTAKRLHPGKKTADRCKSFLRDNLPFVLWSLTNGTPSKCQDLSFQFSDVGQPNQTKKFEDLVYNVMRCSLLHEGEMPAKVEFVSQPYIGMLGARMQFPIALVGALLLSVIASPANAKETVSASTAFTFGTKRVYVSEFIGSPERTKDSIRLGFQYDVEKILTEFNASNDQVPARQMDA